LEVANVTARNRVVGRDIGILMLKTEEKNDFISSILGR
jgi:hypothetical protein